MRKLALLLAALLCVCGFFAPTANALSFSVSVGDQPYYVHGPGEMADADFGYVGGAPGKINLYVGKTPIKFNIPEAEAVDRLVDLIKEHGKWVEPNRETSGELAVK